jgi:hypothetical protein
MLSETALAREIDLLLGIYLNKAGRVNAQFTRKFNKSPTEVQDGVLAKIKACNMKPYNPVVRKQATKVVMKTRAAPTIKMYMDVLEDVRRERAAIADRLETLNIVESYYTNKIDERRRERAIATTQPEDEAANDESEEQRTEYDQETESVQDCEADRPTN